MSEKRLYIGFFSDEGDEDVPKLAGSFVSDSLRRVWQAIPDGYYPYLYLCVFAPNTTSADGMKTRTGDVGIWKIRGNGQVIHCANAWEQETVLSALASTGGDAILRGSTIPHPHPNDDKYNAEWQPNRWKTVRTGATGAGIVLRSQSYGNE